MKSLLWLTLAILIGSYICLPVADPDLWWHITVGRWIIHHAAVPHVDYWNMYGAGLPWRAYSWSTEILFAVVDRYLGDMGLLSLQLIFAGGLALTLQYVFSRIAGDWFIGALFGAYGATACFNHFTLRPQVLVWMYFAALLLCADTICTKGLSRNRLFAIVAIGCVWANTHLTAVLGLASLVLWMLPHSLNADTLRSGRMRPMFFAAAAFFVGTLLTPYLGGEWLTFISQSDHPLKYNAIAEFQPATILQYSTVFVLLALVLQVVVAFTSRVVPPIGRCVLGGGMVMAGLTAVKFLPFAAIVLCALFCVWWREVNSSDKPVSDGLAEGLRRLRDYVDRLSPQTHGALAFFLVCVAMANFSVLWRQPLDLDYVPKSSLDFIEMKKPSMPVLNEFGSGGYLMYRFSSEAGEPKHLVAIDGRTNVNPPEVWQMYQESLLGKLGWKRFITKVEPGTIVWRQGSALVSLLYATKEWCRVFASGSRESDYVVFIRKDEFLKRAGEFTSNNCSAAAVENVASGERPAVANEM